MEPAPRTQPNLNTPIRPLSALNTSAVIVCILSVAGALGIAAISVEEIGAALGAVLSWMILLVIAVCEILWAAGAAVGMLLGIVGVSRQGTRRGAIVPVIVSLLMLAGFGVHAAAGSSLLAG